VRKYLHEILYLLGDERRQLPMMILLFFGASLLDLIGLGLIAPYITLVLDPSTLEDARYEEWIRIIGLPHDYKLLLVLLGVAIIIIFLIKSGVAIGLNYKIIRFSLGQQKRLQSQLMQAYQAMPYTEYIRRNSSEYVYNIQILTGLFANSVLVTSLRTLGDGIITFMILCLLAWSNLNMLMILFVILSTMVFGYDRFIRNKISQYGKRVNKFSTLITQGIHEGIEGFKEIRILGKEKYFHQKINMAAATVVRYTSYYKMISMVPRYLLELLLIGFVILMIISTLLLEQKLLSIIPTLGLFGVAAIRIIPIANVFSSSLTQLRYGRNAVFRLHNDLLLIEKMESENPSVQCTSFSKAFQTLSMREVSFFYPSTTTTIFHSISLDIRAGEAIGLIGASGSGKTTLVDIMLGLLQPQEGKISYNGKPMSDSLAEFRAQTAYLPQQVFLIDNTLRNNVALGIEDENIDDDLLNESLRQARLTEVVKQLPQGSATMLGERGVRLSGGQRQRVALARAFYHGRDVLVMDEATSALDNETESAIVEEIKRLKGSKTMIVIAHRLNTIQHCDRIYRLDQGRIIEVKTSS
jgi:ATP-binding cassette, subfamily B, bacterial PglK